MPLVCTYYEPVPGIFRPEKLLNLWRKSWEEKGWICTILNESDAKKHPAYTRYVKTISLLPTSNRREYERACYLRHMAMAARDGGLLVDYDVILIDKDASTDPINLPGIPTILEPTRVPCAVLCKGEGFDLICDRISQYQPKDDERHVSDMTIIRQTDWPATDACVEHLCSGKPIPNDPGDGWKEAPMIHFSNNSFQKLGWRGDKADLIQRVLDNHNL